MSIADHFAKVEVTNQKPERKEFANKNIWYNWKDKEQQIRFVGDFLYTKTHFIGDSKFSPVSLFRADAFQQEGDNRIPQQMNCANWDIATESYKAGGCIICALNKMARNVIYSNSFKGMSEKDQKEFKDLKIKSDNRSSYRWNIIDRENPMIGDGVKGLKIATVGQELYEQLCLIHKEYSPGDFTSDEEGIDIKIFKEPGANGGRVSYKAQMAIIKGNLAKTPLTDEEKAYTRHKLMDVCGRQVDMALLKSFLLERWTDLLGAFEDGGKQADASSAAKPEEKTAEAKKDGAPF